MRTGYVICNARKSSTRTTPLHCCTLYWLILRRSKVGQPFLSGSRVFLLHGTTLSLTDKRQSRYMLDRMGRDNSPQQGLQTTGYRRAAQFCMPCSWEKTDSVMGDVLDIVLASPLRTPSCTVL